MKKLLLLLLIAGSAHADGPLSRFKDTDMDQEFQNVYQSIRNPAIESGTAKQLTITTGTFTSLTVSSMTVSSITVLNQLSMSSKKITNLANGTASTDAVAIGQLKYVQLVSSTTTMLTNTTSNSFVTSNMAVTITPTSASNRVMITVHTIVIPNNCQMCITLKRGATELSGTACGFAEAGTSSTVGSRQQPLSFQYVDSPASTSALVYTVFFLNNSNGNTVTIGGTVSTLIAEEVL